MTKKQNIPIIFCHNCIEYGKVTQMLRKQITLDEIKIRLNNTKYKDRSISVYWLYNYFECPECDAFIFRKLTKC